MAVIEADAIVNILDVTTAEDIPGLQGIMEARDWEFTAENCEEVAGVGAAADDESTTRVNCDVTFEDAVSKAAGAPLLCAGTGGPSPGRNRLSGRREVLPSPRWRSISCRRHLREG